MKILHVTADWKWTGPADPMLQAVRALRARGHDVDLACPEAPDGHAGALPERARALGVEPAHVLAAGQGYVPLRDGREVRRLRAFLADRNYDVIHAHHTRDHLLCDRALRGGRDRLVFSWHHGDAPGGRLRERLILGPKRLLGLAVLTERLAAETAKALGWPRERIGVVPGVVDPNAFSVRQRDAELRASLGIEPDQVVLGVVARLQPHRRFELLLDAFQSAVERQPALRLLVLGRGTRAREVLEEPVRARGLGKSVLQAGYRREDYTAVLTQMDALVFLVPGSDGSCRAVLETMALGIPTISSKRGVLPETVGHGTTGAVVDEDATALADAMVDVAARRDVWRARGCAARERVVECHDTADHAARLEAFYAGLLSPSES